MCKERKRKWQFVFFYGTLIHIYFFGWWFRMYLAHWPRWKQNHHHVWFLWNFFSPQKQICCLKSVLLAHRVYLPFSDNTQLSRILVKIWHGIYSLVFSVLLSMPPLFGTGGVKIVVFTEMRFLFVCQWKKLSLLTLLVIKMQFSLASAVYAVYFYSTASILFWIR